MIIEVLTVAALAIGIIDAFLSIAILHRQGEDEDRLTRDEVRLAVAEGLIEHQTQPDPDDYLNEPDYDCPDGQPCEER